MNKFFGLLIVCGAAVSVSAQNLGIDLDAQREGARSSILTWKVLSWVVMIVGIAWAGAYFSGHISKNKSDNTTDTLDEKK